MCAAVKYVLSEKVRQKRGGDSGLNDIVWEIVIMRFQAVNFFWCGMDIDQA